MTSALGQGFVLLGLIAASFGAAFGYIAGARRSAIGLRWTRRLALLFAATMVGACAVMWYALINHDFSVSYVAQVGSLATPLHITIFSLWSSLEGSILFWGLILGLYIAASAMLQRRGHDDYLAYTLATLLAIGAFFTFLIASVADPFAPTVPPIPVDGPGPNALLQNHLLMAIHPPMLYLGYVGMSVPFAMAVAALLRGQLGATWLRPMRRWLLVPTSFLTAGVMLGGWWSYEVLGWGGYWAWDPVENASFLPWLTGIAALHSGVVQQRRGTLKAWTVILIMITFLLTILGTFLTRSGVVNSVHSFTQSLIGPVFLGFLAFCTVAVIALLALRVDTLVSEPSNERLVSREGAFLLNNLLLVSLMFTVLVGTLYPIVAESLRGVKVSVGEPYFNRMAVPLFTALLLMMGVGPALPWGGSDPKLLRRALVRPLPAAACGLALALLLGARTAPVLIVSAFAGFTLWVTADQGLRPVRSRRRSQGGKGVLSGVLTAPDKLGAYVVHAGVVITFVAIALSSTFQREAESTLRAGDTLRLGAYEMTFRGAERIEEPHVARHQAEIEITRRGRSAGTLLPSLNRYATQREPIGTPAVRSSATHDLYLTLMNVGADGSIGLRAIVTPAVMWIWIGVLIMVAGTVLCLIPTAAERRAASPRAAPGLTATAAGGGGR